MNNNTKDSADWEKQWDEFYFQELNGALTREQGHKVKAFILRLLSKECPHFIGPNEQARCIICNPRVK